MDEQPKFPPSQRTYWRYSSLHKWHTTWTYGCRYSRRSLKYIEAEPEAQILYGMLYTRPPGKFCKACLKGAHIKIAHSIEDCR